MVGSQPNLNSVLGALTKQRIAQIGRVFDLGVSPSLTKDEQVEVVVDSGRLGFRSLLKHLRRDELQVVCRAHGLDDSGRARTALAARLLEARGDHGSVPPAPIFKANAIPKYAPQPGDIVQVRHRQHLVEGVTAPPEPGYATKVDLVCLDDDAQGQQNEVLWELELGARVLQPETHGLGDVGGIDPPRKFAGYLHALKWNAVTATDAKLFQAPFRAGIRLMNHQLTALRKALSLPRANLFVADDVGLGKTIEAGLVLQELLLRQRVDFVLIVAPASVCLQWREEMASKFGLYFELYNRAFMARRRQERGFGVNPWATHNRFIISYQTLRRPEYRDPLLQHIGERVRKSLLILDEAHTAAPASASKYAIDSRVTRVIRDVAPRFENRLFLSATPHNGHSNSFSSLLEILDPQRFTRGVKVRSARQLESVMVRRLKTDLRELGVEGGRFPDRKVVPIELRWEGGACQARFGDGSEALEVGRGDGVELELSRMLAEYTTLMKPEKGRGKLVFVNLQKRLLSSIEAFHRTLTLHARSVGSGKAATALQLHMPEIEGDEYGQNDDAQEAADGAVVSSASKHVETPAGRARELLDEMLRLSGQYRGAPDGKVLALLEWIRQHQCPAVQVGGAEGRGKKLQWSDRRAIVFTEYGDSKRSLVQLLNAAVEGTVDDDLRVMVFHGGMSDDQREEVQRAFNSPPDDHPVRILVATDAAREGVNLQGHCADLFHFDIPWNPARMEQRNGRIDRTLQPEPEVRCHYFDYPQRPEDAVLRTLVRKVGVIQHELGSLGEVIMGRYADVMDRGLGDDTIPALDEAEEVGGLRETVGAELEGQRADLKKLREEIDEAGKILNNSSKVMDFDPALLRDALDVGLELAGAPKHLEPVDGAEGRVSAYAVPPMPDSWQATLDHLRPPRGRDEPFWEWRRREPMPVVFEPPPRMNSALVQLHLQHPLVQRLLSRFLAQGYSAHDLSRVTIVRTRKDAIARVIAFGRLSLFGPGATRLHDQLVSVAAQWLEGKGAGHLRPFADEADRRALERLEQMLSESPTLEGVSQAAQQRLAASAPGDFATLWAHIRDEADSLALEAEAKLEQRGAEEADSLRAILDEQRDGILKTIGERVQQELLFNDMEKSQRDQYERDLQHMEHRLEAIDHERETEPDQLRELYRVVLRRLEPVGLVYLWPETRG